MIKYTSGPWYLEGHSHKLGYAVSAELQGSEPLAFVKNIHNARLIVAAPDLLEALKLAVQQNSLDMLMTGEELRKCESAIFKGENHGS